VRCHCSGRVHRSRGCVGSSWMAAASSARAWAGGTSATNNRIGPSSRAAGSARRHAPVGHASPSAGRPPAPWPASVTPASPTFKSRRWHEGPWSKAETELCGTHRCVAAVRVRRRGVASRWAANSSSRARATQPAAAPTRHRAQPAGRPHLGRDRVSRQYAGEYYDGDPIAVLLPDTLLPPGVSAEEEREACRRYGGRCCGRRSTASTDRLDVLFKVSRLEPPSSPGPRASWTPTAESQRRAATAQTISA
jgi:hypothetical protein